MAKNKKGNKKSTASNTQSQPANAAKSRSANNASGALATRTRVTSEDGDMVGLGDLMGRLDSMRVDPEVLDVAVPPVSAEDLSPRLVALQQQLEKLDHERYLLQMRASKTSEAAEGSGEKTEQSLMALKKRLSEMRKQLYGGASAVPVSSLANLAKSYFGGVLNTNSLGNKRLSGFPGEGEAFDDDEEDVGELNDDFHDDDDDDGLFISNRALATIDPNPIQTFLMAEGAGGPDAFWDEDVRIETANQEAADQLLEATRLGLHLLGSTDLNAAPPVPEDPAVNSCGDGAGGGSGSGSGDLLDMVNRAQVAMESAVDSFCDDPEICMEFKLCSLREKFIQLVKQDRLLRVKMQKTARLVHDERIQKQLIEMELDKANAIKHRLESLCRDLHNENRRIKAEVARREELTKAEAEAKSASLAASMVKVEPSTDFALPPIPDHSELHEYCKYGLGSRLRELADLYLEREKHFAVLLHHRDSELAAAKERVDTLSTQLSKQATSIDTNNRKIAALTRSEQELKGQVRQYMEKFRQVEETLGKSNDLFGTFRAEMEQMGSKLARLERENTQLNSKCATLSRNIIEMADERSRQNMTIETLKGQKAKLEVLCRTLQAERNAALKANAASNTSDPNPTANATVPATAAEEN